MSKACRYLSNGFFIGRLAHINDSAMSATNVSSLTLSDNAFTFASFCCFRMSALPALPITTGS